MNYYNPYTGNKKKLLSRILYVLLAAAMIIAATVVFGNHLKSKVDPTDPTDGVGREDIAADTSEPIISIPPSENGAGSSVSVKAKCLTLTDSGNTALEAWDTEADVKRFTDNCRALAGDCTGVLIPLAGDDGRLVYNSDRIAELSRGTYNPTLPGVSDLSRIVSECHTLGLRVSAMIVSGADTSASDKAFEYAIETDSRIAADASEAGFDELVVCSLVTDPSQLSGDGMHKLLKYVNQLVSASGNTALGISLTPEIYMTASLSPQIEMLVERSVFLAMTISRENSTKDYLDEICNSLAGTLSVYNMRLLLDPADSTAANETADKLAAIGHENYQFTSVIETPSEPDTTTSANDNTKDEDN